jgi:Ca2+-binding RTX toxin-like protein
MNGELGKVGVFGLDEEWRPRDSRAAARGFNDVTGTSGDDLIVLRKVSSGVSGSVSWGDDRITAGLGADRVDASRGNDLVYGEVGTGGSSLAAGDDRIKGGSGDDRLYGDAPIGQDAVRLGAPEGAAPWAFGQDGGKDTLDGGPGDDLLVGGAGPDDLTGGERADTFLFFPMDEDFRDGSEDRILDFEPGEDKLDLSWWDLDGEALDTNADGILNADDELFSQDGADLVLDLGSSSVETVGRFGIFVRFVGVSELSVDDLVPVPPSGG